MVGGVEALGRGEAHVVAVQGIGHDQMVVLDALAVGLPGPERQVVAVVVAVVEEAALVEDQPPGVGAVAAGVPALGLLAVEALKDLHGALQMLALDVLGHFLVVNPAVAMTGDLVAQLLERLSHFRVALKGHGHAEHGERQAAPFELPQDAPHAGP